MVNVDLSKKSVCAKWIPYELSARNLNERVSGAEAILAKISQNVFVIDEKWMYQKPFPALNNIRAWVDEAGDHPKIARKMMCDIKFHIIVAINFVGQYHVEVLQQSETVNAERYIAFLQNLQLKYPSPLTIMHDNARPHKAKMTEIHLQNNNILRIPQPAYSPDMSLCDRFVFRNLESSRKYIEFKDSDQVKEYVEEFLGSFTKSSLKNQLNSLKNHLKLVIENIGSYLE